MKPFWSFFLIVVLAMFISGCTVPEDKTNENMAEIRDLIKERDTLNYTAEYEYTAAGANKYGFDVTHGYVRYYKVAGAEPIKITTTIRGQDTIRDYIYKVPGENWRKDCRVVNDTNVIDYGGGSSEIPFFDDGIAGLNTSSFSISVISPSTAAGASRCFSIVERGTDDFYGEICYNDNGIATSMMSSVKGYPVNETFVLKELQMLPEGDTPNITSIIPEKCRLI